MMQVLTTISTLMLPLTIAFILIVGLVRGVSLYDAFITGAKKGFGTSIALMPQMIAMLTAITLFRVSGALTIGITWLKPIADRLHFPLELLPLAILRPISGSASLALLTDLFKQHGPDSLLGRMGSVMQGSTDTTLYVLAIYFGSIGITKGRYALRVGLLSDAVSVIASIIVVNWLFTK